jgi:hypothetical protein
VASNLLRGVPDTLGKDVSDVFVKFQHHALQLLTFITENAKPAFAQLVETKTGLPAKLRAE